MVGKVGSFRSDNGRATLLLSAVCLLFMYVVLMVFLPPFDDVLVFFDYSQEFKNGTLFDDDFTPDYPPLAWLFIIIPGLFTDSLSVYYAIFSGISVLCMFLIGAIILDLCRGRTKHTGIIMIAYALAIAFYSDQAMYKFDMAAVLMMVLSIWFFTKGNYVGAISFSMIGGLIKLFPLLLLPVFLIMVLRDRDEVVRFFKGAFLILFIYASIVAVLMFAGIGSDLLFGFVSFQSDRGFHIESVVGSVSAVICQLFGLQSEYIPKYHTYDESNCICDALIGVWPAVVVLVLLGYFTLMLLTRAKRIPDTGIDRDRMLIACSLSMMLLFILFNKVFSTQFIQWLYPLIALFMLYREKNEVIILSAMMVAVVVLSRLFLFVPIEDIDAGQWILVLRDALLFVILYLSLKYTMKGEWGFRNVLNDRSVD